MAKSKVGDLVELDINALVDALAEAKKEHFNLRFQHVTGQLDNTSRLTEVRRQIARINTVLRQREIAAAEATEKS
jgi:large subunit ribosomal protein L29